MDFLAGDRQARIGFFGLAALMSITYLVLGSTALKTCSSTMSILSAGRHGRIGFGPAALGQVKLLEAYSQKCSNAVSASGG